MKKKLAFTLSETMIVVVVLGIIATLTIPALINKNKESVAKTKVKKAMAAYESALNKMIIENDLKSDDTLTTWANATANCGNPSNYFKKVQDVNGCIFKTSDGIWWNISDIERPVISFKEITSQNAGQITTNANNENDKTAFVLVGRFGTDGSLRVDDLAYETANSIKDANNYESKAQVEKLYKLLGLKSSSAGGGDTTQSPFAVCFAENAETCVVDGITYTKMTLTAESEAYEYCDPKDYYYHQTSGGNWYSCGENDDKWQTKTSESEAGDIYVAIEGFPDDYDDQAYVYDGSTCQECIDEDWGDYHNAAKRHCGPNGQLATLAQIKSLQDQLPSDSCFWTFEKEPFPQYEYFMCNDGRYDMIEVYDENFKVLCIGQ